MLKLCSLQSVVHHLNVIFPTQCWIVSVAVRLARHQWAVPVSSSSSVHRMPQIATLVDSRCSNPRHNCKGLCGKPCQLPRGTNDLSYLPLLVSVVAPQQEKIYLCLLLLVPPTSSTEDKSYLSILIPGAGRPCLFILISSICGTAVAGGGWCWQRLVHAFPWQQYSWQARRRTTRTWLINANNETANTNIVGADRSDWEDKAIHFLCWRLVKKNKVFFI